MHEGWSSWVGRVGPPEHLNVVHVDPPMGSLQPSEVAVLDKTLQLWTASGDEEIIGLWIHVLASAQMMDSHIF